MRWIRGAVVLVVGVAPAASAQPVRPPITSVSHLAVYTSDPAKAEAFYVHDLGAVKRADPENPAGTRYYFSPVQFVEVLPLPAGAGMNRLDHAAFNVGNGSQIIFGRACFVVDPLTPRKRRLELVGPSVIDAFR